MHGPGSVGFGFLRCESAARGHRQIIHLDCFVKTHGRKASYAALGRQSWESVGPLVKKIGGAFGS